MKWIGSALLLIGCTLIGFGISWRMKRCLKMKQGLLGGLNTIVRELNGRSLPIPDLMEQAARSSDGDAKDLFNECVLMLIHEERQFAEVWETTVEKYSLLIGTDGKEPIQRLGAVLGRYDTESQKQALSATIRQLEESCADAKENWNRMGKVYRILGLTAGIFLTILLL